MNRLSEETSPYLRQHADNPVDWYPWGEDARRRARDEDKPLFVSIGYASCHWCHVMAHESFEDAAVGADLAESFVSIKIDREERPDIDAVYMAAVQAMTGSGGWPMSVFCTPDGRPFYGGTYFPPADSHGRPGFRTLLAALADAWEHRRSEVEAQADALVAAVEKEVRLVDHLAVADPERSAAGAGGAPAVPEGREAADGLIARTVDELASRFDPEWGGFGPAPKFPRPAYVELCLLDARREPGSERGSAAATMARTTLAAMAAGGIYDHLAGGFARYSTDRRWLVPHFEKMLTDQALLARAYLRDWLVTGNDDSRQVVTETIGHVLGELRSPAGGLYSSIDADAAGVEGSHATWTVDQTSRALAAGGRQDLLEAVCRWYGITPGGNWEGTTVLCRPPDEPLQRPPDIEAGRQLLLQARRQRPQPAIDDKVLTEWNAMFVAVLAEASLATGSAPWARAATEIADFCFDALRRPGDGRWLRSWQGGRAHHLALASDHAWLVEACVRLAELTGQTRWTDRAVEVADALLALFWDDSGVGSPLFSTGHDAESLVVRPKDVLDGAVPAATSVAAWALARLASLTGGRRFEGAARQLVGSMTPLLEGHPSAVADLTMAAVLLAEPAEVVVTGERPDLVDAYRRRWLPTAVLSWGEPGDSPLWADRRPDLAYVCRHFTCRAPTGDPAVLGGELDRLG